MDIKTWLTDATSRRITTVEIAQILGTTRRTATKRINGEDGQSLSADDLITLARGLSISPIDLLIAAGRLTRDEADMFFGTDLDGADSGEMALELARRLLPATRADEIDDLANRRAERATPHGYPMPHDLRVADTSDDEDEMRNEHDDH